MTTRSFLTGVTAIVLSALALFGLRSALASTAATNRIAEQQAMMAALLPDSESFTPENYNGEDENITALWRGEPATLWKPRSAAMPGRSGCGSGFLTGAVSPALWSGIWRKPWAWAGRP